MVMFPKRNDHNAMRLLQRLLAPITPHFLLPTAASPPLPTTILASFTPFLSVNLRPSAPSTSATMSGIDTTAPLDLLFKQKKSLRAKVKKELKSVDPKLRSQEGNDKLVWIT